MRASRPNRWSRARYLPPHSDEPAPPAVAQLDILEQLIIRPRGPSSSQQDPAGGGHKTPEIHRTIVLHDLRRAGKQGVPLVTLRDHLNGLSARPAIDQLAADGYPIVCCPDHRGRPAAILVDLDGIGGAA